MSFPSVTVVTVAAALTAGALAAVGGSLKALVARRLALSDVQTAFLTAALGIAAVVMLPVAGWLTDEVGARAVLCTGSLLAAFATALLAVTGRFVGAFAGALLLGNAGACLATACTVLLPGAFAGTTPLAALNLGYVAFGLGMLLAPWLAQRLTERLEVRRGLGVLALVCLVPAVLAALADVEGFPAFAADNGPGVTHRPEFWLLALTFFLYLPVEHALGAWADRYLGELGHPERRAAWLVTGFWLAFLAGRLAAAAAWDRGWLRPAAGPWLLLTVAVAAGVFVGNLAGAYGRRFPGVGLLAVGALLGPVFPVLAGLLFERFAPGSWGTAFGGAVAVGWLGVYLMLPLFGAYARRTSARQALWVLVVELLLLALGMLALGIARNLRV